MNDKTLNKITKILGEQAVNELRTLSAQELESLIVSATQDIESAKEELQLNEQYIKLKEDKTYMESGLKELRKFNNAKIQLAVALLNERGRRLASGEQNFA